MLKKATSEKLKEMEEDVQNWEAEVSRLQQLLPLQITISRLQQTDIPALEKQVKEVQLGQPDAAAEAEAILERLDSARQLQKSLQTLKQHASGIVRLIREKGTLEQEIQGLESSLRATGSTKTADDLQAELSQIHIQGYASSSIVLCQSKHVFLVGHWSAKRMR
jgi:DNA repair protein RAD50